MNRLKIFTSIAAVSLLRAAVALSVVALCTETAEAQIWRAYPASACMVETDWLGDYKFDKGAVSNAAGRGRRLHCPIVSDFLLRQQDIETITVIYDDKNPEAGDGTAVSVQVCVQAAGDSASHCSDWASSAGTGRGTLNAHDSAIGLLRRYVAGYVAEVIIEIPKKYWDAESSVLGLGCNYRQHY